MQSYQLHIISQQLRRRHPYLQAPFKARYDPTQVYKAVFDRAIPKLIQILLTDGLTPKRYTSALITLNQIASDQVQKRNMINQGCVELASAYAHCQVASIRRQATLLLGLLLTSNEGLAKANSQTFLAIKQLLFDSELQVREAVSWCICRIVLSRMGADILCRQQITLKIVDSFLKYSGSNDSKEEYFIIFLLQVFRHLFAYDEGIKVGLGKGLTAKLKSLTNTLVYSKEANKTIHSLALCVLGNISMNQQGKIECVNENIVESAHVFLQSTFPQEVTYAVTLIMFTSIDLKGKKQCIYNSQGKISPLIISKIIKLLNRNDLGQNTKNDVMETLKIIAQQKDGFQIIAEFMSNNIDITYIQKIFGPQIIVPLSKLMLSPEQLHDPPCFPSNYNAQKKRYKSYATTVNYFLQKQTQAKTIALTQCVNLVSKLALFLYFRGDKPLQEGTAKALTILTQNQQSRKAIVRYLQKYGEIEHKICKTTFAAELKRFPQLKKNIERQ